MLNLGENGVVHQNVSGKQVIAQMVILIQKNGSHKYLQITAKRERSSRFLCIVDAETLRYRQFKTINRKEVSAPQPGVRNDQLAASISAKKWHYIKLAV